MRLICAVAVAGGLAVSVSLRAQTEAGSSAAERIQAASSAAGLAGATDKPWHLKLDATVFDADGKNERLGTVEVWNAGVDRRTVIKFGQNTSTQLTVDGKNYHSLLGTGVPFEAEALLARLLRPGPSESEIKESQPEIRKQKIGKATLDCVMLSQPIKRLASAPLGLFPTYCLDPPQDLLLIGYDFGSEAFIARGAGRFLDRFIPLKFDLQNNKGNVVATGSVTSLATFTPAKEDFTPTANEVATDFMARVSGGVVAGNLVKKVQPVYPESAKINRVSGAVVLRAIIGPDGRVHSLRPVTAPDPDLALAAIYAVRQWTYKPYLLNGEPTSVDTTITVNFAMN
jgi:TonB family protein